ncbi:MAG: hypothetical protein IT204_12390 [Fimbriimonadaceae bacterium]|nr:hypothetical protein [Fimbriimonadaceae bacterium]
MTDPPADCHCDGGCGGLERRGFLTLAALGTAAALLPGRAMAGPFEAADFEKYVPADKKLDREWVKSLLARGERTWYRGPELQRIGLPVGGICAGQLYLGGDGRLWHWDLWNRRHETNGSHYANPLQPSPVVQQGLALLVTQADRTEVRPLDASGWADVRFAGEYPLGLVEYRDPACPLTARLEAYSPFIPLRVADSSYPATLLEVTVTNTSAAAVTAELAGWLQNLVCVDTAAQRSGISRQEVLRRDGLLAIASSAKPAPAGVGEARPDLLVADFEQETYGAWTATGTAFGPGPLEMSRMPGYQGAVGGAGKRVVNTHNTRNGEDVGGGDRHTGTLTSPPFKLERHYLNFLIGGGNAAGRTCVNLLVAGQQVLTATGQADNRMQPHSWDVRAWEGRSAQVQIVDNESGGWGNVGFDHLVQSDLPGPVLPLAEAPDFGSAAFCLLDAQPTDRAVPALPRGDVPLGVFAGRLGESQEAVERPFGQPLVGTLSRPLTLAPGASQTVTFAICWHFPNLEIHRGHGLTGRHYATRWPDATAVATALAARHRELGAATRLWQRTWYDSTLPWWFLDRTFANTSILATSTCHRFASGRFWGWEGVGCCYGTCCHVWHYAQAVARLFPELEQITREQVDFGSAQVASGLIRFRGETAESFAADGHCGTVLRAYREHQMSPDGEFLKRIWPRVKRAVEYAIAQDGDDDGVLTGRQHNTLDADWFGPVAWLSGLYVAMLRAAEAMASLQGDAAFAQRCRQLAERGAQRISRELFNGEYFIHRPDPAQPQAVRSAEGCSIDQVFGDHWARIVGLGRLLPEAQVKSALAALYKYNFAPDVGPHRAKFKSGRWFAMPGEGGLLMATFPKGPDPLIHGTGDEPAMGGFAMYFNECMSGFEYQAAAHMIWEGLVPEGLAVCRAIHDRYHAARRNPYNEIECGDHYARAMASYGAFTAACGWEYDGPAGHLGFSPRLAPEAFRAAFTAAEGWGSLAQTRSGTRQTNRVEVAFGQLRLQSLALTVAQPPTTATVRVGDQAVAVTLQLEGTRVVVKFAEPLRLTAGQSVEVLLQ